MNDAKRIARHEKAIGHALRKRRHYMGKAIRATFALADACFAAFADEQLPREERINGIAERLSLKNDFSTLVQVACEKRVRSPKLLPQLPLDYVFLAELLQMDDATLKCAFADGIIKPDSQRAELHTWIKSRPYAHFDETGIKDAIADGSLTLSDEKALRVRRRTRKVQRTREVEDDT